MRPIILIQALLAVATVAACAPTSPGPAPTPTPPVSAGAMEEAALADSVRRFYTPADVDFVTGMLHHHQQALVMARMAPSHEASPAIRTLAARIINSQRDEIALMRRWLRERGEPVPDLEHGHRPGAHHGHAPPMAGMLTEQQLRRLDEARGPEWDRLFLTYMIQHHQGAVQMVDALFATHGAGQGDELFKIAADIGADQASEIDRMQRMLRDLLFEPGTDRQSSP